MNVNPAGAAFCASCGASLAATPGPTTPGLSRPRATGPTAPDPVLGRVVAGRFKVLELIGQGGMGRVYKALHLGLDKVVCLKTLRPALLEDPTIVGRFEREAKAASRLDHPNSIQVLDFGQDESGTLFLVMEFVPGRDLRRVLRDEFPLGEERIAHLVGQVLGALAKAHAQGVIHRDLKPENILVSERDGERDFVKVLDFGIAKIQDGQTPGLTRQDMICGTPEYMSPEQAQGLAFDQRADLYAIGVILYQLVTGVLPFEGDQPMQILTKHVNDAPVPPSKRRPDVTISPAFEALVLRALDKDPAKRPQSADAMRRELVLATKPAVPPVGPLPVNVGSPSRTIPQQDPLFDAPVEDVPHEADVEAALPKSRVPAILAGLVALGLAGGAGWFLTRASPAPEAEIVKPQGATGGLTLTAAYNVIESHFDDIRACFEKASKKLNEDGKVVLTLAIGAEGQVDKANIAETTFQAPKLERCIVQQAVLWTFDKPRGGSLFVSYPYVFRRK